jgi:nucleotide-binding universal stress UspA family protein
MFSRVLVGVDGEQGGRDAIALAARLADEDASTQLVNVFGAGLRLGKGSALLLSAELEWSRRLLERERELVTPEAELISCADRSIGHALHVLAERHGADLIVIGACRHGFLGRALFGNDTIAALNGAPCAIAVGPFGYADRANHFDVLGVAYDGSPESEHALVTARTLAARFRSTVKALSVVSLQSIPYGEPIAQNWPDAARRLMDDQRRQGRELADVEGDVTYGDPSEELLSFGDQVDLLVVGSRGYGPVGRMLHGSTSNQLARRARCPLLVLPRSVPHDQHDGWDLPLELAMSDAGPAVDRISGRTGDQVSTSP